MSQFVPDTAFPAFERKTITADWSTFPMSKFTLTLRKQIENKLLDRTQFVVDLKHSGTQAPTREEIKDIISTKLPADKARVVVFGLHTQFGGGRTTGFGLVYKSLDALKVIEPKHRLIKAGLAEKSKKTRRMRKNSRKQKMKVWGSGVRAVKHKTRRQQRKEELGNA
jgi:small subunit ribosomal protein S24e